MLNSGHLRRLGFHSGLLSSSTLDWFLCRFNIVDLLPCVDILEDHVALRIHRLLSLFDSLPLLAGSRRLAWAFLGRDSGLLFRKAQIGIVFLWLKNFLLRGCRWLLFLHGHVLVFVYATIAIDLPLFVQTTTLRHFLFFLEVSVRHCRFFFVMLDFRLSA